MDVCFFCKDYGKAEVVNITVEPAYSRTPPKDLCIFNFGNISIK
jgi:hypothetical protein